MAARKKKAAVSKAAAVKRSAATTRGSSPVQLAAGSFRAAWSPRSRSRVQDGSGDFHLDDFTRRQLRMLSRDLERNNHCYDGLLSNFCVFLVGSGPRPIWRSKNEKFNTAASELFAKDGRSCNLDGRGMTAWAPWVAQLARCVVRDGDAGVWHQRAGKGILLESDRIDEVQLDKIGRVTGYRIVDSGATTRTFYCKPEWVSLIANRTRPSQTRGHPVLSASLDDWERLDSLNEAEIISAEASSLPWTVIKQADGKMINLAGLNGAGNTADNNQVDKLQGWMRSDAGAALVLPPGLDAQPWAPNRPNLNVPEFVRQELRHMCLPLLPYEIAFLDIGALNYAAIRGLGKLATRRINDARTYWLEPVITRMAIEWARAKILAKELPYVAEFDDLEWQWDALEIRDREKDATATEREMANGTTTLQDELGPEWRRTIDQRAMEKAHQVIAELRAQAEVEKVRAELRSANLLPTDAPPTGSAPT